MPRRSRIDLPGVAAHIVQRGNNRAPCFYAEQDRNFYLFHLRRLLASERCSLHAYCLMTNHVHLLVTPECARSCSRLMKHLGQLHAQYVNRGRGRTGSLWEGRFRSCLVQSESYVLACYRYIELNPVRSGLSSHPRDYLWSSYQCNAEGRVDGLVTPHEEFLRMGASDALRRAAYRDLIEETFSPEQAREIREATNGNFALGSDRFKRSLAGVLGRRVERASPGRPTRHTSTDASQIDLFENSGQNVVCP